jgi:hypothetical protein
MIKFSEKKIQYDEKGLVKVGAGTQFANPFKFRARMQLDCIEYLDGDDLHKFLSGSPRLTRRDCFLLYAKYIIPQIPEEVWEVIRVAKGVSCDCDRIWCHGELISKMSKRKRK